MSYLSKIHNFFKNLSTPKFIIIMTLLTFVILIPFYPILHFLSSISKTPNARPLAYPSLFIYKVFVGCIIAPICETLTSQTLIIYLVCKIHKLKNNNIIAIFISALLFGLGHYYSISYMFQTFIVGILLAYSYVLYENKPESPFWVVSAIHSLRNFISVAMMYF
ncbi:CPBP family intramembrane metalloprotease [Clostridium sp. CS001]|uniref:CPBP family intramembrane glutamic endopeptidase n=1 Tax=Clostridium sp. CS001 TaxID=2880648 RepID=UPI001CF2196C|nr:CPBP family intramembrane glutamic endopeptidase [Clostridium sp. CS001]MCB2291451.1 CPBP family intramembrane metalloprotease [Clostridium sp. CS001]